MTEIQGWTVKETKTLEPTMTLTTDGPVEELVASLGNALDGAGFRLTKQSDTGFKARRRSVAEIVWGALLGGGSGVTTFVLVERSDPQTVRIQVSTSSVRKPEQDVIVPALNSAVAALELRGRHLTATPWARP